MKLFSKIKLGSLFFTIVLAALFVGCATDWSKIKIPGIKTSVGSFNDCFIAGGHIPESNPPQCFLGKQSFIKDTKVGLKGERKVMRFQVEPKTVICQGLHPVDQKCLVMNGEYFYQQIDGYNHKEGQGRILSVERLQICNPKKDNDCLQDASIYQYKLLKIEK